MTARQRDNTDLIFAGTSEAFRARVTSGLQNEQQAKRKGKR